MSAPFDPISDLRAEFADPAINRGSINKYAALGKQISGILIGKWIAQVHPNRAKNDDGRKTVVLERLLAGHDGPFCPDLKHTAD